MNNLFITPPWYILGSHFFVAQHLHNPVFASRSNWWCSEMDPTSQTSQGNPKKEIDMLNLAASPVNFLGRKHVKLGLQRSDRSAWRCEEWWPRDRPTLSGQNRGAKGQVPLGEKGWLRRLGANYKVEASSSSSSELASKWGIHGYPFFNLRRLGFSEKIAAEVARVCCWPPSWASKTWLWCCWKPKPRWMHATNAATWRMFLFCEDVCWATDFLCGVLVKGKTMELHFVAPFFLMRAYRCWRVSATFLGGQHFRLKIAPRLPIGWRNVKHPIFLLVSNPRSPLSHCSCWPEVWLPCRSVWLKATLAWWKASCCTTPGWTVFCSLRAWKARTQLGRRNWLENSHHFWRPLAFKPHFFVGVFFVASRLYWVK